MQTQQLIYFADPMCSWCWGFSAVMRAVTEIWGESLPVRLIMGGLRPGVTEIMAESAKGTLRSHWREVTEASGQLFGPSGLDGEHFIYDTDPAARAVVIMRRLAPQQALAFLGRVQQAFYAEGIDVTKTEALALLAAEFGQARVAFEAELHSEAAKQETWRDYSISRGAGVSGFPTLILGPRHDGTYLPITRGFQPAKVVLPAIAGLLPADAA